MRDNRRDQLLQFVEREFIGPDPVDWDDLVQDNGEEILSTDPPRTRYIAGILFPTETSESDTETREDECIDEPEADYREDKEEQPPTPTSGDSLEYLENAEELINRSNAYQQSAISITAAVQDSDELKIDISAGTYSTLKSTDPKTNKPIVRYHRKALKWNNEGKHISLPSISEGIIKLPVGDTGLQFDITPRYRKANYTIYTFTLENTKQKKGNSVHDEDCFFQVKFVLVSAMGFNPLPDSERINTDDEDYWSNQLLYRNAHNYAIGHGCAANWDESNGRVNIIESKIFPSYEVKPIVPSVIEGVSLEMKKMSPLGNFDHTIQELRLLSDRYRDWINGLKVEKKTLSDRYIGTADRHIRNCEYCLARISNGIDLLKENEKVRVAFQYMNLAMLMQQLHYNLPLQKWEENEDGELILSNAIKNLPDVSDENSWHDKEHRIYGKWRPFQLAFILMNLRSMIDKNSNERGIVDLIWFPTGGGKTEAYLGLSAYTIFIRRLMDKSDSGTAILMRYTLRLLTAQQYERASAMICACELIRKEHEDLFGHNRISIGLWVGGTTTPNTTKKAVIAYDKLYSGRSETNPFVMLKCPWCGAQMGVIQKKNGTKEIRGYYKTTNSSRQRKIVIRCSNKENGCAFSNEANGLPLYIVDEEIYESTPTLLLGTVDKFAMLPFRPKAQSLFGFFNGIKKTSPDLIIQDELHLISGPLGSMVGHYETLIHQLCASKTGIGEIHPKIIASTATISRAKEQCHALYGCGRENVFQFPPSGLDAGSSFFAEEDKDKNGRQYVGVLASASSSDATTAIRLYASLLYGAKTLEVEKEEKRDPYWTNIGYFNSIRELGQAATWIRADIDQHLDVMYKRKLFDKRMSQEEYQKFRRYIWRYEELTSRIRDDKVTASLANLGIKYPEEVDSEGRVKDRSIDICLATNMISVGLDVPRLGLMTVMGQPKTTSEYIQATSRVGRDAKEAPGIVFVVYNPGRPRDKSHYEHFREYHSRIYCNVEPTSVTPFSAPVRERALHAIMIGMMRMEGDDKFNADPPILPDGEVLERIRKVIENRIEEIDSEEMEGTLDRMEYIIQCWEDWSPQKWEPAYNWDLSYSNDVPLMFSAGSHRNEAWGQRGIETPTSMRNVDASCEATVLLNRYSSREV